MKKLIPLALTLSFVLALTVSATATTENLNKPTETSKPVYATYIPASTEKTVYSIDITWGDMQFQYREGSNGTWNPETLKYDNKTSAGWYLKTVATSNSIGSNQVLISNRSNAEIYCSASFILDPNYTETFGDISGSFDTNSFKLLSAAEEKAAQEKTLSLSLSGLPTILDFTSPTPLGTITLTFESNS